jgi:hypothetical protein
LSLLVVGFLVCLGWVFEVRCCVVNGERKCLLGFVLCFGEACLMLRLCYFHVLDLDGLGWNVHDAWCDVI